MFLTGDGRFSFSRGEIESIRKLCLEGSMLFADSGSLDFDRSFKAMVRQAFPDKPLRTISDDDPILKIPNRVNMVAMAKHGGEKPMGIRHGNRWIVFYTPGELNDFWKDSSKTGRLNKQDVNNAYRIGYNIIWYSVTNYLRETKELREP